MKSRERVVVYTLMAAVILLNAVVLIAVSARPAFAELRTLIDDLGPADSLILAGDEELAVRNEGGRLAWSDNGHGRAYSVGFVNIGDILPKLMETDVYAEDRQRLTDEIEAQEVDWQEKYNDIQEKYQDLTPESPEFEGARAELGDLQRQVQQWQQASNKRVNDMAMQQLEQAYREIVNAVDVVAEERRIDLVFRFTPTDDPLAQGLSGQTMLDIRMRPVLKYPDGLDITLEVLEEMALETE